MGEVSGKTYPFESEESRIRQRKQLSKDVVSAEARLPLISNPRELWNTNGSIELFYFEERVQPLCTHVSQSLCGVLSGGRHNLLGISRKGCFHLLETILSRRMQLCTVSSQHSQQQQDGCTDW